MLDLIINDKIIKNSISEEIFEHYTYLLNNPDYYQFKTNYGYINQNEAIQDLLLDYCTNELFDYLESLFIRGKTINIQMYYINNNIKYTLIVDLISEILENETIDDQIYNIILKNITT